MQPVKIALLVLLTVMLPCLHHLTLCASMQKLALPTMSNTIAPTIACPSHHHMTVLPRQHGKKKSRQRGLLDQLRMPATDFSHYPTGWFLGLRRQRWLSTCSVRGTTSPSLNTTCMGLDCCSSAPVADSFPRAIWMPSAMGPRRDTPASCAVQATQHHTRAR